MSDIDIIYERLEEKLLKEMSEFVSGIEIKKLVYMLKNFKVAETIIEFNSGKDSSKPPSSLIVDKKENLK